MKAYIGCFGSGFGHASRMLEVANLLRSRGAAVELSSSGEVASLIEGAGYRCNRLPLADVKYSELGEFLVMASLGASPSVLARTYVQLERELANIIRFSPDVVLSDSALSTLVAAKILGLPVYTVLNQLNLTSYDARGNALSRLLSVGISSAMGRLWEFSDEVLLPDLPPPYTISERNLWGSNVGKTRYVGFLAAGGSLVPDDAAVEFQSDPKPKVFWQVSGPPQTRGVLLKKAIEIAESLAGKYSFVVSAGDPASGSVASRFPGGWFYGWCGIAELYFRCCDLVVSRAGHGTIGQAITRAKPSLLIPIPRQPEQEGNAAKAVRLGVSLALDQEKLGPGTFDQTAVSLLHGGFTDRAASLAEYANRFDAGPEIVRTVEAASRVHR